MRTSLGGGHAPRRRPAARGGAALRGADAAGGAAVVGEPGPVRVLDVGLGAATNALAVVDCAHRVQGRALELTSLERDEGPLRLALGDAASFPVQAAHSETLEALLATGSVETPGLRWTWIEGDATEELARLEAPQDVICFDPFSPEANPELWTVEALRRVHQTLAPGGVLSTYSASTRTRVTLLLAGFWVGAGAAAAAKKETTVASDGPAVPSHRSGRGGFSAGAVRARGLHMASGARRPRWSRGARPSLSSGGARAMTERLVEVVDEALPPALFRNLRAAVRRLGSEGSAAPTRRRSGSTSTRRRGGARAGREGAGSASCSGGREAWSGGCRGCGPMMSGSTSTATGTSGWRSPEAPIGIRASRRCCS